MKKNILLIGSLLLALTSCYKSQLDPLSGKFPTPTKVEATTVTATAEKLDAYHLFTVIIKDGSNTLNLVMAGEKYYLPTNTYIGAEEAAAKKGNFILGKTTVNGTKVISGKIVVYQTPVTETQNVYSISAVLFLENGDPFTAKWTGTLEFFPDPIIGDIVVENSLTEVTSTTEAGTTKHVVTIMDSDDEIAAYFELYTPASETGLAGVYQCIEYAENNADGWVVSNGWSFPEWGIAGGSHFVIGDVQTDLAVDSKVNVVRIGEGMYSIVVPGAYSVLGKVK